MSGRSSSQQNSGKSIICSIILAIDVIATLIYVGIEYYYDAYPTLLFKLFMIYMFTQIDWTQHMPLKWIWIAFVSLMTILSIGINIYSFSNSYNPEYVMKLIEIYTKVTEIYNIYHLFFLIACVLLVILMMREHCKWKEYFNILNDIEKMEQTKIHGLIKILSKVVFFVSIVKILVHIIEQSIAMKNNSYILPSTIFSTYHDTYTRRAIQALYIVFLLASLLMKIQIHLFSTTMTQDIKFIAALFIIHIAVSFIGEEYHDFALILVYYLSIIFIWQTRNLNIENQNTALFPGNGVRIG